MPFYTRPEMTPADAKGDRVLLDDLKYLDEKTSEIITVPCGFASDGYSVPKFLRWIYKPWGKGYYAAVMHDWECRRYKFLLGDNQTDAYTRKRVAADKRFCRAMRDEGVWWPRWWLFYRAVRMTTGAIDVVL